IPANVVAYGVPCKVIREIGDKDREFYYKNRKLDVWE
ncbi:MAG: sugar O-acetyltransferase, partial [Lachnospiraceae bacterium]|nr:sugar O-acetyltransferase [Lachnospiraceae bacterium]